MAAGVKAMQDMGVLAPPKGMYRRLGGAAGTADKDAKELADAYSKAQSASGAFPTPTTPTTRNSLPLRCQCDAQGQRRQRRVCGALLLAQVSLSHTHARTHTHASHTGIAAHLGTTGIIVSFSSPTFSSGNIRMRGAYSECGSSGSFMSNSHGTIGGIKQCVTLSLRKGVWPGMPVTGIPTAGNPIKLRIYTSGAGQERQKGDVTCTLVGTFASGDGRKIGAPSAAGGGGGK
jgi:hypothetical protein